MRRFAAFLMALAMLAGALLLARQISPHFRQRPEPEPTQESTAAPTQTTQPPTAPPTTAPQPEYLGRWQIPDVGIDVACYADNSQTTVDALDSAAFYFNSGHDVIADHNYQGFHAIAQCEVGTLAYFVTDTESTLYICTDVIEGHNTEDALTDGDYVPINAMYPNALVNYTCADSWQNVIIAFFELA